MVEENAFSMQRFILIFFNLAHVAEDTDRFTFVSFDEVVCYNWYCCRCVVTTAVTKETVV